MKTIQSIGRFLPGVIISFALLSSSFEVSAQKNRDNKNHKEFRSNHSNSDFSERKDKGYKANKKYYNKHDQGRHNDDYEFSQHYYKKSYHADRDYYNHPKYGRVYQRFDERPVVFRHSHGDYYYAGNRFYTYRAGIGYCAIEPPREVYFSYLPFECNRIHVNNHVYFRHGDLFFSYSPRGYVIVPPPIDINLSVRF